MNEHFLADARMDKVLKEDQKKEYYYQILVSKVL